MVGHNSRKYLDASIPGILNNLRKNDEFIFVDNDSDDGSAAWISEAFPRVQMIVNTQNLGFGGANNAGVEAAKGKYLIFINPDTSVEDGWLDALIHAMQINHDTCLVTCKVVLLDNPSKINACGNDVHISGITLCRGMGQPATSFCTPTTVNAVSGAAFAMPRKLFRELDGFDQDFFMYMEDTDLSLRARLAGKPTLFVPDSIVNHAYALRFGPSKTYFQERNRYLMLLKLYHWRTLLVLLPILILGEMVTWGFVLLQEPARMGNKFRAYGWVIKNWKQIVYKHRQVQRSRQASDRILINEMITNLDIVQVQSGWMGKMAGKIFSGLFYILKLWVKLWIWW